MVVPEAAVLKVYESFRKILRKTSVLESLFKRNSSTDILRRILRNF